MSYRFTFVLLVSLQIVALVHAATSAAQQQQPDSATGGSGASIDVPTPDRQSAPAQAAAAGEHRHQSAPSDSSNSISLEPRLNDRNFIKDIVDRLHSLDADIGKLINNSTTMYSPNDHGVESQEAALPKASSGGSERFSEVLVDLDSLQDEIGGMIYNATRSRQYNMLVRLRPLNNILYRIRHNLHLMRNSLVAINTVASLEKLGNSVLDSTLSAFMRPDANVTDEISDSGNYDIDLDKPTDQLPSDQVGTTSRVSSAQPSSTTVATTPSTSTTTITTSTTTTTTTTPAPSTSLATSSTTRRPRPPARRTNNRQNQRRGNSTSTTTQKPPAPRD